MVCPLFEGTFTVDESKKFIPFNSSKDKLDDRPASLLVDIVPFLIKTNDDLIIIDPGLGLPSDSGNFYIDGSIRSHGFSPDEITMVLLSHLHKDHAGGVCYGKDRAFNLMFPTASYFCQQKELEYAFTKKNSPSYEFEKLEFLQHSPNLKLLTGDGDINSNIHYEISGGHTPYHQVFFLNSSNEIFFYGGDVLPQSSQIIRRFIAKYDYDGKKSTELRQQYAHRGAQENWTFLFFHDGKKPIAHVREKNNRFEIEN